MDERVKAICDTVWPWRTVKQEADPAITVRQRKYLIQWGVMVLAALVLYGVVGHRVIGGVIGGLSVLLLFGYFFSPRILRGFDAVGHWLARTIGGGLTWILLVPFFYLVFGVGRLFLRLRGRDLMCRHWDATAPSYWTPHPRLPIEKRYHKQY